VKLATTTTTMDFNDNNVNLLLASLAAKGNSDNGALATALLRAAQDAAGSGTSSSSRSYNAPAPQASAAPSASNLASLSTCQLQALLRFGRAPEPSNNSSSPTSGGSCSSGSQVGSQRLNQGNLHEALESLLVKQQVNDAQHHSNSSSSSQQQQQYQQQSSFPAVASLPFACLASSSAPRPASPPQDNMTCSLRAPASASAAAPGEATPLSKLLGKIVTTNDNYLQRPQAQQQQQQPRPASSSSRSNGSMLLEQIVASSGGDVQKLLAQLMELAEYKKEQEREEQRRQDAAKCDLAALILEQQRQLMEQQDQEQQQKEQEEAARINNGSENINDLLAMLQKNKTPVVQQQQVQKQQQLPTEDLAAIMNMMQQQQQDTNMIICLPQEHHSCTSAMTSDAVAPPKPTPSKNVVPKMVSVPEKKRRRGRSGSFPQKIHQMLRDLEDQGREDVASFVCDGSAFCIHRHKEFAKEIMPKYFKMGSYASFQRQLNLYNFTRISEGPDRGAYHHDLFLQGKPLLSTTMKRKEAPTKKSAPEQQMEQQMAVGSGSWI